MYLVYVLEKAKKIFHKTILYDKGTNLNNLENTAGPEDINAGKIYKVKHWAPPPIGWLWNTNASRIGAKCATMINYVCQDNPGQIQFARGRMIHDYPVFVMGTLVIREAV